MLQIIQANTGRPISYPVNPNAIFEPGMIAQMQVINGEVVLGVSDGTAPFGIIDDVKSVAFTASVRDEIVIIPISASFDGYNFVSTVEATKELQNAGIVSGTFVSDTAGLQLNPVNGILRAPVGTVANYTINGSDTPNAVRARVHYNFRVPGIPGDDTTVGSGQATIWFTRGVFATDQYEQGAYQVNAPLYVSQNGKLTTNPTMSTQPGIAMVVVPPTAANPMLEFLWF